MEGAQALQVAPARVAELHMLRDHVGDRGALTHERDVLITDPPCHDVSLRRPADISCLGQAAGEPVRDLEARPPRRWRTTESFALIVRRPHPKTGWTWHPRARFSNMPSGM
ncbi:hypothetical protein Ssi02_02440 [Sinosporangium siamense]|uniref:Uncharacterized protein n=1 Tax=Sinosporangium siamense TaxID=1367973 RepID=A0A919R9W0_9ACTN|nr:hypothetical protein Ssi02_02440 [Sinosporangium siamense]